MGNMEGRRRTPSEIAEAQQTFMKDVKDAQQHLANARAFLSQDDSASADKEYYEAISKFNQLFELSKRNIELAKVCYQGLGEAHSGITTHFDIDIQLAIHNYENYLRCLANEDAQKSEEYINVSKTIGDLYLFRGTGFLTRQLFDKEDYKKAKKNFDKAEEYGQETIELYQKRGWANARYAAYFAQQGNEVGEQTQYGLAQNDFNRAYEKVTVAKERANTAYEQAKIAKKGRHKAGKNKEYFDNYFEEIDKSKKLIDHKYSELSEKTRVKMQAANKLHEEQKVYLEVLHRMLVQDSRLTGRTITEKGGINDQLKYWKSHRYDETTPVYDSLKRMAEAKTAGKKPMTTGEKQWELYNAMAIGTVEALEAAWGRIFPKEAFPYKEQPAITKTTTTTTTTTTSQDQVAARNVELHKQRAYEHVDNKQWKNALDSAESALKEHPNRNDQTGLELQKIAMFAIWEEAKKLRAEGRNRESSAYDEKFLNLEITDQGLLQAHAGIILDDSILNQKQQKRQGNAVTQRQSSVQEPVARSATTTTTTTTTTTEITAEQHFNWGNDLMRAERFPEAIEQYKKAQSKLSYAKVDTFREMHLVNNIAQALLNAYQERGLFCRKHEKFEMAITVFQTAFDYGKDEKSKSLLIETCHEYGKKLYADKNYEKAIAYYNIALKASPENQEILEALKEARAGQAGEYKTVKRVVPNPSEFNKTSESLLSEESFSDEISGAEELKDWKEMSRGRGHEASGNVPEEEVSKEEKIEFIKETKNIVFNNAFLTRFFVQAYPEVKDGAGRIHPDVKIARKLVQHFNPEESDINAIYKGLKEICPIPPKDPEPLSLNELRAGFHSGKSENMKHFGTRAKEVVKSISEGIVLPGSRKQPEPPPSHDISTKRSSK